MASTTITSEEVIVTSLRLIVKPRDLSIIELGLGILRGPYFFYGSMNGIIYLEFLGLTW